MQSITGSSETSRLEIPRPFDDVPIFIKPGESEKLALLKAKLAEWKARISNYKNAGINREVRNYRVLAHRVDVLTTLLGLNEGERIAPKELLRRALLEPDPGHAFSEVEFYEACAAVGHHLGTPFPGVEFVGELSKSAMAA